MNSSSLRRLFIFVIMVLLQSFIFTKLPLTTYVQPCIYVLFILLLPVGHSRITALLWAFCLGLCVDLFTLDVIGINTAVTVALAFIRPYLLKLFLPKSDIDAFIIPTSKILGIRQFLGYSFLSLLFHQTLFFLLDAFAFYDIFHTLLRILMSTVCSVIFILLLQSLFHETRKTLYT
ncbi:MAG: rod shape-determining protein MreD [Prevotellaceae bacterium]|nr:rod shape-determining protein MreD [Prevotellaceae bacterium]